MFAPPPDNRSLGSPDVSEPDHNTALTVSTDQWAGDEPSAVTGHQRGPRLPSSVVPGGNRAGLCPAATDRPVHNNHPERFVAE